MRKTQEKLLTKAKNAGLSQISIAVLSREDLKVDYLNYLFEYIREQKVKFNQDEELLANEAKRVSDFLVNKRDTGYIKNDMLFKNLFEELLPHKIKDDIVGSNNKWFLYRAYKFSQSCDRNVEMRSANAAKRFDIYKSYSNMLRAGVNHKHAAHVTKELVRIHFANNDVWFLSYRDICMRYKCLTDDLAYNGEKALIYYLIKNKIVKDFYPVESELDRLYDYEKHCFKFNQHDFNDYFISNKTSYATMWNVNCVGIANKALKTHPLIVHIEKFRKSHNLQADHYQTDSDMFQWKYFKQLKNESKLDAYKTCAKMLETLCVVNDGALSLGINISTSLFMSIKYKEYNQIELHKNYEDFWRCHYDGVCKEVNMFISPDGKIFRTVTSNNKTRNMPLTMKEFMYYLHYPTIFGDFMKHLAAFYVKQNRFVGDVISDFEKCECIMPITFNDILGCHNKTHFLNTKYKTSIGLKTNWNKKNLNVSYMIIKSYPKVSDGASQGILLQQNDILPITQWNLNQSAKADEKIRAYLTEVIYNYMSEAMKKANAKQVKEKKKQYQAELDEIETEVLEDEWMPWLSNRVDEEFDLSEHRRDIADYVRMCMLTKQKIKLDVKSINQATNLHDNLAHREHNSYYREHTQPVKVPKNTKFKKLREILPQEFEWIQTRKRLILETELQHHCVWSYAHKISDDRCAIYSFVDSDGHFGYDGKPKRYTIEFYIDKDKKYGIVQVQGKYDRAHTEKMRAYIQEILDKKQKDEEKAS